jgi:heterotetrameric sarcosine oxidase gamma subunit
MAVNELQALPRERIAELGALVAARRGAGRVRLVEPLHVVALRMLPGGADAVAQAAAAVGIDALPPAGRFASGDAGTLVLWRNPTELMLVTPAPGAADAVLQALAPRAQALACAVDQSDGIVTFELAGAGLDDVLQRLLDATAVPREPGHGTRARLADIAVFALRIAPDRAWLMADRANDQFLAHWIAYATDALS